MKKLVETNMYVNYLNYACKLLQNYIWRVNPQVVSRLVHLLGTRILGTLKGEPAAPMAMSSTAAQTPKVTNLATVAVIAISNDVPIANFSKELEKHLSLIGRNGACETCLFVLSYSWINHCFMQKTTFHFQ